MAWVITLVGAAAALYGFGKLQLSGVDMAAFLPVMDTCARTGALAALPLVDSLAAGTVLGWRNLAGAAGVLFALLAIRWRVQQARDLALAVDHFAALIRPGEEMHGPEPPAPARTTTHGQHPSGSLPSARGS
jgi:hypothetical protein